MRIVSWNMNHKDRSHEQRGQAWEYLRATLQADVVLAQEVAPPHGLKQVYRPVGDGRKSYEWGSAVLAIRPDLDVRGYDPVPLPKCYMDPPARHSLPDSHPGACAVADVLDADVRTLVTVVSLYGQFEGMPGGKTWESTARLHRMLSDLTSVLSRSSRRLVVLAGDWNIGTQLFPGGSRADAESADAVFARLRAWGLTDVIAHTRASRPRPEGCACLRPSECSHVRTIRFQNHPNSPPCQLDYAYASKPVIPKLQSCVVVDDEQAWALSDHCPIVLELSL